MDYYRVVSDLDIENRWMLGKINFDKGWDIWQYIKPRLANLPDKELTVGFREKGECLDFTFADYALIIVNEKVTNLLNKNEVQLIPISIEEHKEDKKYFLMVVLNDVECFDEEKSIFEKWEENNKIRPDKAGQYRLIEKLVIDPTRTNGLDIFRIKNSGVEVIISGELKEKFYNSNITGVKYIKVT